ncbi:mediator of RNA polymerase II transcription subunit 14-like isoform X2 [Amphiura filiformis]|uniref:mediator of RNA polymerase II transcription subunit 14-like isoform X2 n=1 Tax=Amphiura filiformis TaxID=82378 RepID=UPI003B21D41B
MPPISTPQTQLSLTPMGGVGAQVGQAPHPGNNSISLGLLLDFLVQKTYHELSVLGELLPRKMDMERKIEIVKFARSTRQAFVRLLALVKWASSAAKVDKCAAISAFLDQQSLLFVDTADMMARMARENLVNARLPNFSLPCAVDVLTTGCYRRLPTCIKEKIVPPDPITSNEKASVLQRLNQIIQHRLVTSELPPTLVNLTIAEGRAKFHVPQEFEATLTLMGDDPAIPWRLLNIDILVSDPDTGDGKVLVHSMQVNYIHQLVQSRLFSDEKPLTDMYNCLHVFCQSLQLEVLNSQAQRLIRERWGEHVMIEKYMAGQCLTLAYWRAQSFGNDGKQEKYTLSVGIDSSDAAKPLQVNHEPPLPTEEAEHVNQAIRCDRLSIERLLVETVLVRSKIKLQELQTVLQRDLIFTKSTIEGTPALLYLPIVEPCSPAEYLTVSVDLQTGVLQPNIAHCETGLLEEIEECLNSDPSKLASFQYIATLRTLILMEHCKQSVQLLPVRCWEKLPLVAVSGEHPLNKLSSKRLYLQLMRHSSYYIVVDFKNKGPHQDEIEARYHLMRVRSASFYDQSNVTMDMTSTSEADTAETYLAPLSLLAIDPKGCIHGPDTYAPVKQDSNAYKRKLMSVGSSLKRQRYSTHCEYFQSELAHIVAMCDARIPYITLCEELTNANIPYQGVQVEAEGVGLVLRICELPSVEGVTAETNKALASSLLDCSFRLQPRGHGPWQVQLAFGNCPLSSTAPREQGSTRSVYLTYEAGSVVPVLKPFLLDWKAINRLYQPFLQLAEIISDPSQPMFRHVEVRSFNYQKLTLAYGKDKTSTMTVLVDPRDGRYRLLWGVVGASSTANCHVIVQHQLTQEFNEHQNLVRLISVLCETQSALQAICKLPTMPLLGATQQPQPVLMFSLLPQSSTHIRVVFRNTYCLDIHICKGKNTVSIRDGAYSMFDIMKVVDGFTPAAGLKAFLEMFVDESQLRRRSVSEDDNPPSPITMESSSDNFLPMQHSVPSPMNARVTGSGFAHPMTPPTATTSNPATPASPHTSVLSNQPYSMSPGPSGYPLASPPSIAAPSPSGVMLGTPSPGITESQTAHSPFTNMGLAMASPGTRNWPASPSMPGPSPVGRYGVAHSPGTAMTHSPGSSGINQQQGTPQATVPRPQPRILPHRSWAAAVPTILSHENLHKLFTPAPPPGVSGGTTSHMCSPIERFLGCVYLMRRCLNRQLQAYGETIHLTHIPVNEHGVTQFKSESLIYRITQNPTTMQTLQLQVNPHPDCKDPWSHDELQVLEKFFETKVGCPPYKYNAMVAFVRLLGAPTRILKDCIQLLRLELLPDRTLKWTIQWCLTIPPSAPPLAPVGTSAVVIKNKILFFIQLTRIGLTVPQGQEPQTVVIPILHDIQSNTTQHADLRNSPVTPSMHSVQNMMKRFNELYTNKTDCTIFAAVKDLMANLVIPH